MRLLIFLILLPFTGLTHPGIGIVKDSKGNVFYTDLKHVWKIDGTGKKSIAVHDVHTHELFIDGNDNLFGEHLWYNGEALNTWGHYVWKLSADGKLDKVIPATEGFRKDYSFVQDHQGRMYHAQGPAGCQHVLRVNSNKASTILGDQCLNNIRWMTAGSSGRVYLVDNGDVKQVDPSGLVKTLAAEVPKPGVTSIIVNKNHYLGGLAVDKAENIYVCDYSAHNVKMITKEGDVSVVIDTGSLWAPSGILLDEANGDFWVLECSVTNEVRVEKVSNNGKRVIY